MSPTSVCSLIRIMMRPPWRHLGRKVKGAIPQRTGHSTPSCDRIAFPVHSPRRRLPYGSTLASRPAPVVLNAASGAPVPALASRSEPARADRDPAGEVPMSDEDPALNRRRRSRGVRKPGRWGAAARAQGRARGARWIGPAGARRRAQHRRRGFHWAVPLWSHERRAAEAEAERWVQRLRGCS
jgi:hypothetical protein